MAMRWRKLWCGIWLVMLPGLLAGMALTAQVDSQPRRGLLRRAASATLVLPQISVAPGIQVTVPLEVEILGAQVYSADITVSYDSAVATAVSMEKGAVVSDWSLASNLETPGVVRVALAGAQPVTAQGVGVLLKITFQAVGQDGDSTALTLTQGDLNEGNLPTTLQHGQLTVSSSPCYNFEPPAIIDAQDLGVLAVRWRLTQANSDYKLEYDVAPNPPDGIINILDIMTVQTHLGERCQQ